MSFKKTVLCILALGGLVLGSLQAIVYQMDNNPIGSWLGERMFRQQIALLQNGTIEERIQAAFLLGTVGFRRKDVHRALKFALKYPNPTVAANATLGLRFGFNEPLPVTRETYRLAALHRT